MKYLLLIAGICGLIFAEPLSRNPVNNERYARQILENSRRNFPCGWPEYGIGPIDPLFLPYFQITQRTNGVNVVVDMTNVNFLGLRHFIIERFIFNADQTISYTFFVDYARMDGDHITRGSMVGIPVVNGQGRFFSEMFNSRYHGTVRHSTQPGTNFIFMVNQVTTVEIQHMTMQMTGFGALNATVNQQVNDQIPYMIMSVEFQQQMNDMLDGIILPIFNAIASGQTVNTITNHLAFMASNPRQNC
ncbi:hypothetical protein ACKWTF_005174 [Chironomus riparius]